MAGGSNPVPKFRRVEPLLAPEALCDSHRGSRATAASAPAVVDAYASANPNVGHERIADAHKRERASGAWGDRIHADTAADCTIGMATTGSRASTRPGECLATPAITSSGVGGRSHCWRAIVPNRSEPAIRLATT